MVSVFRTVKVEFCYGMREVCLWFNQSWSLRLLFEKQRFHLGKDFLNILKCIFLFYLRNFRKIRTAHFFLILFRNFRKIKTSCPSWDVCPPIIWDFCPPIIWDFCPPKVGATKGRNPVLIQITSVGRD